MDQIIWLQKTINQIDIQIKDEKNDFLNMNNTDWSITLALIIYRKLETSNTDLQELIDVLGDIVPILEEKQNTAETSIPMEENLGGFTGTEIPIEEDVGDLDLLLYENKL